MTNTMFPGRPDYTGPTKGLFGFVHHKILYEMSHDINERLRYVKTYKPKNEIPVRLYNMIYLGPFEAKRKLLYDDYEAKQNPLYDDYRAKQKLLDDDYEEAKRKLLDDDILSYIKKHIPDCAWNGKTLVFE